MAGCRRDVIISLLALLAVALPCSAANGIRGLDPLYKSKYDALDGKFTCLDGSKTMPASHINDAFCDCLDGSDEPGTSACPNGKFYCANIGSEPLRLNSSFVDDGICDCCDGSDEPQGRCKDTCKEAGVAALAALEAELKAFESGFNIRNRYVKAAEGLRRDWTSRLEEIAKQYSPSEIKSNELGAERDRLEKQLNALEAKKTKMEAALAPPAEPVVENPMDTTSISEDQAVVPDLDSNDDSNEELATDADDSHDDDDDQDDDDSAVEAEESAEDIAKRVASQWIPGSSDKKADEPQHDDPEDNQEDDADADIESTEGDVYEPSMDALASATEDASTDTPPVQEDAPEIEIDLGLIGSIKAWIAETAATLLGKPADAAQLDRVRTSVEAVRSRYESAKSAFEAAAAGVYALKSEREGLETKIGRSYGPDDVYAQLVDRCVEAYVDKYTYKVCPFHQVGQLEDGHGPRLGSWKGFDESGEHMLFDNGDVCWQGPNRSMTVRIRCGATETLTKVAEPSRCEYTAEMTTPAACSEERVVELREAIAAKKALLDGATATGKDEL